MAVIAWPKPQMEALDFCRIAVDRLTVPHLSLVANQLGIKIIGDLNSHSVRSRVVRWVEQNFQKRGKLLFPALFKHLPPPLKKRFTQRVEQFGFSVTKKQSINRSFADQPTPSWVKTSRQWLSQACSKGDERTIACYRHYRVPFSQHDLWTACMTGQISLAKEIAAEKNITMTCRSLKFLIHTDFEYTKKEVLPRILNGVGVVECTSALSIEKVNELLLKSFDLICTNPEIARKIYCVRLLILSNVH